MQKKEINVKLSEFLYPDGYSLRINAFFSWLHESQYSLRYIARQLHITSWQIIQKLKQREKFSESEIRELVYIMGAEKAFFIIYFPSFKFRQNVYFQVFGKEMKIKNRKRRRNKN